jgi:AcrR family transcriptional regulator
METARRILQAAQAAFARNGTAGLSMRHIAGKVGVTPMAIYRHYPNKQALIDALVLDALAEWWARVAAISPAVPLEWLAKIGEAHLDFALKEPRRYEAAFLLHSSKARRYPDDFVAGHSPAGALQLKLISDLLDQGVLKAASPIEIMIVTAGLAQGLITLYRAGRIAGGEAAFRELYRRATRRCIEGFFAEKTS